MKVTVDIECTPAEARAFLGLPDVAPLQVAVMDSLRDKMIGDIEKLSPESIMKTWLSLTPVSAEKTQEFFNRMFAAGFGQGKG